MYERTYHNQVLKKSDESLPKKAPRFSWKRFFVVLGIGILLVGGCLLIRADALQVQEIQVDGASVLDTEDVEQATKKALQGRVLWVFPRTSTFLVQQHTLEHMLKEQFSRIETVSIQRDSLHSLVVSIKEYEAVYLWCTKDEEMCYFMDNQGAVYTSAPVFSGTAYPKIVTGAPLEALPFKAMTHEDVDRIGTLEKGLSDISITPVLFRMVNSRHMDIVFLHNKTTAVLRIDPTLPVSTTLEYIFSGLRAEPLSSLFRNSEKVLEYIDVRFSNKVVYKFQE